MNGCVRSMLLAGVLLAAGCVTLWEPGGATRSKPDPYVFTFAVQTDPPGAAVIQKRAGEERRIGTTPLVVSVPFVTQHASGEYFDFSFRRIRRPAPRSGSPVHVREEGDTYVVRLPGIELHADGYAPEPFEREWRIPTRLRQRVSRWETVPVPRRYEETVVFRRPTQPQYALSVSIRSDPAPAALHAVDEQGKVGRLIGHTPLDFNLGFALARSATGAITDWVRWGAEHADLWAHTHDGVLLLNGYLVHEGYEPEAIQNFPVTRIRSEPEQAATVTLPLLRPTKPHALFTLHIDSLPSGAALYAARDEGILGQALGRTPLELTIGLAQERQWDSRGRVAHRDWRIWAPEGFVRTEMEQDGSAVFYLACAAYKEDFAIEHVLLPIFRLAPGSPYPSGTTLTIPLLRPEEAVARETMRSARVAAREAERRGLAARTVRDEPQPGAVPHTRVHRQVPQDASVRDTDGETTPRDSRWKKFWRRLIPRRKR